MPIIWTLNCYFRMYICSILYSIYSIFSSDFQILNFDVGKMFYKLSNMGGRGGGGRTGAKVIWTASKRTAFFFVSPSLTDLFFCKDISGTNVSQPSHLGWGGSYPWLLLMLLETKLVPFYYIGLWLIRKPWRLLIGSNGRLCLSLVENVE